MDKAIHEAKLRTSWVDPHAEYDTAVREFVAAALDDHPRNRFLPELRSFHDRIVPWGLYTALGQVVLKLASPGVPDIYQGQELWDFSLVDPDNRRPVDFARRQEMLAGMEAKLAAGGGSRFALARRLAHQVHDPRIKLSSPGSCSVAAGAGGSLPAQRLRAAGCRGAGRASASATFAWRWASSGQRPADDRRGGAPVVGPARGRSGTQRSWGRRPGKRRAPLGPGVWADTRLLLEGEACGRLRNVFTGQVYDLSGNSLPVAEVLS